jgi:phosphoglycolate phosphatase
MTTILFDLDGTLVDSRLGILGSLQHAVRIVFPDIDIASLNFKIGPPVREIMKAALISVNESQLSLLESAFRSHYDTEGWKTVVVYPGVGETLKNLKKRGIAMHVFTNKPKTPTTLMLNYLGLEKYFTEVYSLDTRNPSFKDKAEMAKSLLEKCQSNLKSTFFVGDSDEDRNAAEKCGAAFLGIEYGYGTFSKATNEIPSITSFSQLLTLV